MTVSFISFASGGTGFNSSDMALRSVEISSIAQARGKAIFESLGSNNLLSPWINHDHFAARTNFIIEPSGRELRNYGDSALNFLRARRPPLAGWSLRA